MAASQEEETLSWQLLALLFLVLQKWFSVLEWRDLAEAKCGGRCVVTSLNSELVSHTFQFPPLKTPNEIENSRIQ